MSEAALLAQVERPPRRFRAYAEYKGSGMEWLRAIPAHWSVAKLKNVAQIHLSNVDKKTVEGEVPVRLCNYVDVYRNERITGRLELMEATATPEQVRRLSLRPGDVLITKDSESWTDIAVPAVVVGDLERVLCGYHLALIRADVNRMDGLFLARAFAAVGLREQFQVAANGITRFGIGRDAIRGALFPVPPLSEQHAITAFIDREAAKIDALVAKKELLIELVKEKRAAVIDRAVTGALDQTAPRKESEAEWLGEIPAHWTAKRLWHLTQRDRPVMYGIVLPGPNVKDGVPIVKGGDVAAERLRLDQLCRTTREIEERYTRSRLEGGDLVYAIRGSIGEVAVVPDELTGANLTQDAARISYTDEVCGSWLLYALRSSPVFAQLEAGALGATIRGINIRDLKRATIPVPPPKEQLSIAALLDRELANAEAFIAKVRTAIAHLHKLRTALISAAVTGKIDVREEVAA